MIRFRSNKPNRRNLTVQISDGFQVHFDENGECEIPADHIELVVKENPDLEIASELGKVVVVPEQEAPGSVEEVPSPQEEPENVTLEEPTSVDYSLLKVDELREICRVSNLPESEYKSLKKVDLIEYIKNKMQ